GPRAVAQPQEHALPPAGRARLAAEWKNNDLRPLPEPPPRRSLGHAHLLDHTAAGPRSPVRMRTTSSTGEMKIFPSPIRPVRAPPMIASTASATRSSVTRT